MTIVARLARWRVPLGFVTAIATFAMAHPTWTTWGAGLAVALCGEAIRVWAAGHLEKNREVTQSGPYRWMQHPLYVGSTVMATGIVIAARSAPVAVVAVIYIVATIGAAVRTEQAFLRRTFGEAYEQYRRADGEPATRRFSLARARRNREHRAVIGLAVGFALLALKVVVPI